MSEHKPAQIESMSELIQGVTDDLAGLFGQMEWAEDEIAHASQRHPTEADLLFHSFRLLTPTHHLMTTEFVYRAHCRELLERVIAGQDTRPGTASEICCACCEASQLAPFTSPAAGLYLRMWAAAFPDKPICPEKHEAYEVLESSRIDELETAIRNKLAVPDRELDSIDCMGRHHGESAECRYHTAAEAA